MTKTQKRILIIMTIFFISVVMISPFIGQIKLADINWSETFNGIKVGEFKDSEFYLLMSLRVPRVVTGILAGMALAVSGLVMQACIQNPLADPYILGVSSGATAGATFAIVLLPVLGLTYSSIYVTISAFVAGVMTTFIILKLSHLFKNQLTLLILIGVVINALCQSLTSFFIYRSPNADAVKSASYWTMGSLVGVNSNGLSLIFVVLVISFVYLYLHSYVLDLLLLGKEQADSLGINSEVYQKKFMFLVAILTSVVVSQTGVIGFVGLIVPHLARKLVGNKHQLTLLVSGILGSILLLISDILARILVEYGELPIGIVTSLIGAPLFFFIIIDKYKMGGKTN